MLAVGALSPRALSCQAGLAVVAVVYISLVASSCLVFCLIPRLQEALKGLLVLIFVCAFIHSTKWRVHTSDPTPRAESDERA